MQDEPYAGVYDARLRQSTGYIARSVNVAGKSNLHIRYCARVRSFENGDQAFVLYQLNGGPWVQAKLFTSADSNNTYACYTFQVGAAGSASTLTIAFDANMNSTGDYWYLDEIEVWDGVPPAPAPSTPAPDEVE